MPRPEMLDVLIVSLASTGGLRAVDDELLASLLRVGASAELVRPDPPPSVRTLMLTDLRWARAARRAAQVKLGSTRARALIYSTSTAALLWPRPGAIRFDALAAANRPGRHGLWQRPLERRRLREAPLLLPQSQAALDELGGPIRSKDGLGEDALVLPVPVEPSGDRAEAVGVADIRVRDIPAIAYASNPTKKGIETILECWAAARKPGEELRVVGVRESELRELGYALPSEGVRIVPMLSREDYRALLRRSRVFVCAARREDYGVAQLEALADGCMLVTTPSPGPYVALPIARELDARLVGNDLTRALRTALDDPLPDYAQRALRALAPFRRAQVDRLLAEQLLPRLLAGS